jgi:multidrug efflux pump
MSFIKDSNNKKESPPDINTLIGFDVTEFIRESITEVQQTIFVALGLVIIIIFFF